MKIGELKLKNKFIAAPLAGFSDAPWRLIVTELGASLTYSEMISVEGLFRAKKRTLVYLNNYETARPFGAQLFGHKPESFARAIELIKDYSIDVIDINMGCPVKKVVGRGEGSALMKTPKLAQEIIAATRAAWKGPLTVKIRTGWDDANLNALEIAKIAEGEGADALIVHGRTRMQSFSGPINFEMIAKVKSALKIPVVGNGDIVDTQSARQMFELTGCDAVMIGRAALGNPWIFRELTGGEPASLEERIKMVERHVAMLDGYKEKHMGGMIKKFVPKYLKGVRNHKELSQKIYECKNPAQMHKVLNEFKTSI